MNSRRRCTFCRGYFAAEQINRQGTCGEECLRALAARSRKRQQQRVKRTNGTNGDLRARIRRRDGEKCRWCSTTSDLQVHHILYRSQQGPNCATNLVTLCGRCHAMVHTMKWYYQPILLGLIWMGYVEGRMMTGPQFIRWFPHLVPRHKTRD